MHSVFSAFFAVLMAITAPVTHVGDIAVCAFSEQVSGDHFVFTGHCPRFSGMGNSDVQKKLNAQMREREKGALSRTKAAAVQLLTGDRPEQLKAEGYFGYEVKRNSGGIVSLLFNDMLSAGKSDSLQTKTGLTFSAGSGETYTLPGLFMNSEEGMKQVNEEIDRQLDKRGLSRSLEKANPVVGPGQQFYLTDSELILMIPEMTWFDHSMGIVEFTIPLSQLRGCLRNEFVP